MDLVVIALTFGAIFLVELPDKTFLATLVLSTKYRPVLVWLGVGLAFALQVTLAVALGQVVSFLPDEVVRGAAALLFLFGAVLLFREGRSHHEAAQEAAESEQEIAAKAKDVHGFRAVLASFLVLFAAEWGDLSQLLTISLVAKYEAPASVWVGALAALLAVSGLAVLVGRALLRWLKLHVLHYAGSLVCLALATLTVVELMSDRLRP